MKTTISKIIMIAFLAFGSRLCAFSQQYPDSLMRYLDIAARNNPTILQKFNEYQAALLKVPQAGSLPDPELSAGVFLSPMELVNGNQVADIRLMQMFPWFGVLRYAKDEMSMMANAKFELFKDSKLQVLYDVQRTWYELYKVQKDISISEKNVDILKLIERLAIVRFKSGSLGNNVNPTKNANISSSADQANSTLSSGMQTMGAGQGTPARSSSMQNGSMESPDATSDLTDIYRIQIESGDLVNNIELLKNQKNSIIARFNTYLNRPLSTPVYTYENIPVDSLQISLSAIPDSILSNNPMLGMLGYEKQSLEARKKMVTRMGYPMVGLGLDYTLISKTQFPMGEPSMNGKDMFMPMVVLTLPVYRKKYNAMKNEAEIMKSANYDNYQATANSLQAEYYQAVLLYQDSQRRVKLNESQYQLASKSLDLALRSFSTSSTGLTDVLRVRQQSLDFEFKKVEALADLNTAIAWLKRLMAFSQIQ
jgi:outer membrane protein TolC